MCLCLCSLLSGILVLNITTMNRREFFKQTTKKVMPLFGLLAFPSVCNIVRAKGINCDNSCSHTCSNSCKSRCQYSCFEDPCGGTCAATCKGTCRNRCFDGCTRGCGASCYGSCSGSSHSSISNVTDTINHIQDSITIDTTRVK